MANTLKLEIIVDDKGTPVVQKFADGTTAALGKVETAGSAVSGSFQKSWAGIATGANQAVQLFQQVSGAVQKAVAYMDVAGQALQVESSFKIMAAAANINSEELIASMKKATRATIDDSDLMQKAVKLMLLGYNPEQIKRFSEVVVTASQYAGTTATDAYNQLADAIGNRQPKAMVRMGAVSREQMQIVTAAIAAGADSMVLFEMAMSNLELKQKMLQGTQDSATISLQAFHAQQKETTESIGKGLIVVFDAAFRSLQFMAGGVLGLVAAYAQYRTLVYEVMGDEEKAAANRDVANAAWAARNALIDASGKAIFLASEADKKATAQEIKNAKEAVAYQQAKLKFIADEGATAAEVAQNREKLEKNLLTSLTTENKNYYDAATADVDTRLRMVKISGENELNYVLGGLNKKKEALNNWYDRQASVIQSTITNETDKQAKLSALDSEYNVKWNALEDQTMTKTAEVAEFRKKAASSYVSWAMKQATDLLEFDRLKGGERQAISADTWDKIQQYESLTGQKIRQDQIGEVDFLIAEYDRYLGAIKSGIDWEKAQQDSLIEYARTKGGERVAISADTWDKMGEYQRLTGIKMTAAEAENVDLMLKEYKDTFAGGVNAALLDMEINMLTWGKASYDITKTFADSSKNALSTILFDSIKTGTFDAQAVWTSFTDTMLRKFTDIMAQMVVKAAMENIVMNFGATWTDAAKSILGTIARIAGGALETWWNNSGTQGDIAERATGGPVSPGKPYWVGEKGPEIAFFDGPGYVMEHNQSMAYAARNGGYIPGRMLGGPVGTDDEGAPIYSFVSGDLHDDIDRALLLTPTLCIGDNGFWTQYARTATPYDGGWTATGHTRTYDSGGGGWFGDFIDFVTAMSTGGGTWAATQLTGGQSLGDFINSGGGNIYDWIHALADPSGAVSGSAQIIGANAPPLITQIANIVAPILGAWLGGPGGAAAGAGIMADWNAGASGTEVDRQQAMMNAGIAAVLTYVAQTYGPKVGSGDFNPVTGEEIMVPYDVGVGNTFTDVALDAAKGYAKKWAINQAFGAVFPAENGGINFNYEGMGGGPDLSGLAEIAPQSSSFAFSARNGLDYVPRDNFPIRAHQGEAVLTKGEADQWRGGGGVVVNINIEGDLIGNEDSFNELVEKIDYRLGKLQAWGH